VPVKTYTGRGAGVFIENQVLTAKEKIYVCSPWISKKYAEKLVQLAKSGVEVKIITSEAEENKYVVAFEGEDAQRVEKDYMTLWNIYRSEKRGVEEIVTLEDVAKKVGVSPKDLFSKL